MAKTLKIPPTNLPSGHIPASPFNVQAKKEYIFNETGNIMLASTEIGSENIAQSVRDVFAEVSVFFAAMTRAMSTTIDPLTNAPYSLYDYVAIQSIVEGSGLFVHVSEEDIDKKMSSWGATVSKELIEGLLGIATGEGELAFAQAMVSSIGKQGLKVGADSSKADSRVGSIVFVCEYLLGMPIVSAIVVYVDSKEHKQSFHLGPCVNEHSQDFTLKMHKDTYMFVTPNFIKEYSGDLLSIESDIDYLQLVDYLQDLVERKPDVQSVVTKKGDEALSALTVNDTYYMLGAFLAEHPAALTGPNAGYPKYRVGFVNDSTSTMLTGDPQSNVVAFTPTVANATAAAVGLYVTMDANTHTKEELIVTAPMAYTVVAPGTTITSAITAVHDSSGQAPHNKVLTNGSSYKLIGTNLLGGGTASAISVKVVGSAAHANDVAIVTAATNTNTSVEFKVTNSFSAAVSIGIYLNNNLVAQTPLAYTAT